MMHRRNLGLALAALAATPPARAQAPSESTFERVRRSRVVRVGAVGGQAPYCTRDLTSGEWRGFIPDFGRDLAKALDAKGEFVETNWGNAVLDLQADKVDIFFGSSTRRRSAPWRSTSRIRCSNNLFTLIGRPGFRARDAMGRNEHAIGAYRDGDRHLLRPGRDRNLPECDLLAAEKQQRGDTGRAGGARRIARCWWPCWPLSALKRNPGARRAGGAGAAVYRNHQRRAAARGQIRRGATSSTIGSIGIRELGRMRRMVIDNLAALVGITDPTSRRRSASKQSALIPVRATRAACSCQRRR